MASKPTVIKPTLTAPEGINNYSGDVFRCFTKGDTLPFRFTFKASDGTPININGWKMIIVFASGISCNLAGCDEQITTVEVEIPIADDEGGVFEGEVSDIKTQSLPCGVIYAMAKYVTAVGGTPDNPIDGSSHILDMCRLEVYPNLTFTMH